VVEDLFLSAQALAAMVVELGYDVAGPVPSVDAALALLESERVDAALLDVNLRGELVTPVALRLEHLGVPFAFLTAHSNLELLPASLRGAATVHKPCGLEALASSLRAML